MRGRFLDVLQGIALSHLMGHVVLRQVSSGHLGCSQGDCAAI